MIDALSDHHLAGLATACSGSAQALRHAIVAVEDEDWQRLLREAYLERVELFEVCARCLLAGDRRPDDISRLAAQELPDGPVDDRRVVEGVVTAERKLEWAIVTLARQPDGADERLVSMARAHLAGVRELRRQLAEHGASLC